MSLDSKWAVPRAEKLKQDMPRNKCPLCGVVGFKKNEVIMRYLYDCYRGRFTFRYAHMLCVLRLWRVYPPKSIWTEAQKINLLEAI